MMQRRTVKVSEPRFYGLGWLIGYVEREVEDKSKDNNASSTTSVNASLAAGIGAQKGATLAEPLPEVTNPLEPFYAKLRLKIAELDKLMLAWVDHKVNYIKGEKPHPEHDHAAECPVETADKVKSAASNLFEQLKEIFLNARDSLEEKIDEAMKMHIKPLDEHIASLLKQSVENGKTEDERREIAIHAANAYILLTTETRALLGNIEHEIEQRVAREGKLEATASIIINAAIYLIDQLTGIPFPYLNFDCTERYAHSLDNQVVKQEVEALEIVGAVEGLSAQGERVFQDLEAAPSNGGIFTPRRVQNDEQALNATEEARSELRQSSGQ